MQVGRQYMLMNALRIIEVSNLAKLTVYTDLKMQSPAIEGVNNEDKSLVIKKCYPEIVELLDIDAIFPHLMKENLLTPNDQEILVCKNSDNTWKINYLMLIIPRKTENWYDKLIAALEKSCNGTGHKSLVRALKDNEEPLSVHDCSVDMPLSKRKKKYLESSEPSEISSSTNSFLDKVKIVDSASNFSNAKSFSSQLSKNDIKLEILEKQVTLLSITDALIEHISNFHTVLKELQWIYVTKYRDTTADQNKQEDQKKLAHKLELLFKEFIGCSDNFDILVEKSEWQKTLDSLKSDREEIQKTLYTLRYEDIALQQENFKLDGKSKEYAEKWIDERQIVVEKGYNSLTEIKRLVSQLNSEEREKLLPHVQLRHDIGKRCLKCWNEWVKLKSSL